MKKVLLSLFVLLLLFTPMQQALAADRFSLVYGEGAIGSYDFVKESCEIMTFLNK